MLLVPFSRGFARQLSCLCLAFAAVISSTSGQTAVFNTKDGYDPNVDGVVMALAMQADGKAIVAGQFSTFTPNGGAAVKRNNIARLNSDGSVDNFDPNANGAIRAVVIQPDGHIIIGGDFTSVGGKPHNYIARLNAVDGSVDETFTASIGKSLDPKIALPVTPQVFAVAFEGNAQNPAGGWIVVGGSFGSASSATVPAVQRNNLVRFALSGEVDTSYDPNPNAIVLALTPYGADEMLVAGGFKQLTPNQGTPVLRARVARLTAAGSVDDFTADADDAVTAVTVQRDGQILLGGAFTQINGANRIYLARVDPTGAVDANFAPSTNAPVSTIVQAPDGTILIGGRFEQVSNTGGSTSQHSFLARLLLSDGSSDDSFNPSVNAEVNAIAVQPDGLVVIGGAFTRALNSDSGQIIRNHLARILPSGAIDAPFFYDTPGRVLAAANDATGTVLGGTFSNIGGVTRLSLARMLPDGTIDQTYDPDLNGAVYALAYDPTTKSTIVGGAFTTVGKLTSYQVRTHIARINSDGTVDSTFAPNFDQPVTSIVVLADGSMIVGGAFTSAQPAGTTTPISLGYIAKITSAGQIDTSFAVGTSAPVIAIAQQSDKRLLIGGAFTSVVAKDGAVFQRNGLARLNTDGTIDRDYNPNPVVPTGTSQVNAIVLQPDGKALVGGSFGGFVPQGSNSLIIRSNVARINADGSIDPIFNPNTNGPVYALALQADKKVIIGGAFTMLAPNSTATASDRLYLARVQADGTLDTTFNLGLNQLFGNRVDFLTVLTDGEILVGGSFTSAQPADSAIVARNHLLRLTATGTLDPTFTLHPDGTVANMVQAIALQPDARILVGGNFKDVNGAVGPNLARFSSEGTPDFNFNSALSAIGGAVNAIVVRPTSSALGTQLTGFAWLNADGTFRSQFKPNVQLQGHVNASVQDPSTGQIYVAGIFAATASDGTTLGNILRLNPDGSVDPTYTPTVSGGIVLGLTLQADKKLILYGEFTTVDGIGDNYIARLNPDGTADTGFNPNPDSFVHAVVVQPDGHIIFGGEFTTLKPAATTDTTAAPYLARVDSTGAVDTNFQPSPNAPVIAMVQQSDGAIVVAGPFTTINPAALATPPTRNFIARLKADLTLDAGFDPNANAEIDALALQPDDQKIVIGGQFSTIGGIQQNDLARLNANGTVDTSFTTKPDSSISFVQVSPDKSIIIAGSFASVTDSSGVAVARHNLARLAADGKVDQTFNPAINGQITGLTVLADNSVLVGGTFVQTFPTAIAVIGGAFQSVAGQAMPYLAEINADGSIIGGFRGTPDQEVRALLALPDGGFLAGGLFTKIGQSPRGGLARFDSDGVLDASFTPPAMGAVETIALQADGQYLVGTKTGLVRLTHAGAVDASFVPGVVPTPAIAIAVQADGKVLVAGATSGVVRLNADGSVDSSFKAFTPTGTIQTLTVEADGAVIVAGLFTVSADGQTISNVARLSSNGTVDSHFNPAPDGAVDALALQSDGRLLLGGAFTNVSGVPQAVIARVGVSAPAPQTLAVSADNKTITLLRSGTAGEVQGVTFEVSTDGFTWTLLGYPTRTNLAGQWQLTNVSLPASGNFYIRARAIVPTSAGKSSGVYETVIVRNATVNIAGVPRVVGPVSSTQAWDSSHYVWTIDAAGTLRIADGFSFVTYNSADTVLLDGGTVGGSAAGTARLANLSTRGVVSADSPLIGGFSIVGSGPRQVLIRAAGPGLAPFGVTNYLKVPDLVLSSGTTQLAENKGWDSGLTTTFARLGAFPFTPGSSDAAFVVTLSPGTYTVQVADAGDGKGGDAIIEIYDAGDRDDNTAQLGNLSARATVNTSGTLISGLVITGTSSKTMLVRGIGPGLTRFGVSNALVDPEIAVYNADGAAVATNDNWGTSTMATIASANYAGAVGSAADKAGAFSLDQNSSDAAVVISLQPGTYTVQLHGANDSAGAGLIELYDLK